MANISRSKDRFSYQRDCYIQSQQRNGKTPENDVDTKIMMEFFMKVEDNRIIQEDDKSWQENNLEYELRTSDYIIEKCKQSKTYSQNLYAALCNNNFVKKEMWPMLQEKFWHCSWRHAGGIVADLRQEGDYIDWYCSGMYKDLFFDEDDDESPEQKSNPPHYMLGYTGEGHVTDEINQDLEKLGWKVIE